MRARVGVLAACAGLVFAIGCGGDDEGSSMAATNTTAASTNERAGSTGSAERTRTAKRRGSTVKVMRTRYGRILVDGRGRALYLFTREGGKPPSRCYGDCAVAWPPFHTRGRPRAGTGAKSSLLGTTKRRNGRAQVTYNGHPLYYYVTDRAPGEVTCQDVEEFGGTWLVVAPNGSAIR